MKSSPRPPGQRCLALENFLKSMPRPPGQRCLALENFLKSTTPMAGTSKLQNTYFSILCAPFW